MRRLVLGFVAFCSLSILSAGSSRAECGSDCTCWADQASASRGNCTEQTRDCSTAVSQCKTAWFEAKQSCRSTYSNSKNSCDSDRRNCVSACEGDSACLAGANCEAVWKGCYTGAANAFTSCDSPLGGSASCEFPVCGLARMSCADARSDDASYQQCRSEEKARKAAEKKQ